MEWWQIVLILLGSITAGTLVGFLISRLINRFLRGQFIRKRDIGAAAKEQRREMMAAVEEHGNEQKHKETMSMAPLFSRRTILALGVGLIIGAGLGLGYWAISPINVAMGWPPVQAAGSTEPNSALYETTMSARLMDRGNTEMTLKGLQLTGEYYAAKMNSSPFLAFLSQKIAEENRQYSYSADELAQMARVRYDWKSDEPAVEIKITSPNEQEALFLISFIPQAFEDFLVVGEANKKQEEYQNIMTGIESAKAALYKAEQELASLELQANTYDVRLDPAYVALSDKATALEIQLSTQAGQLAVLTAEDNIGGMEYRDLLLEIERTSVALSELRNEQASLEASASFNYSGQNSEYMNASAKVAVMREQVNALTRRLASWVVVSAQQWEAPAYFTMGTPSTPAPLAPERIRGRDTVMMGGVFGMGVACLPLSRLCFYNIIH